MGRVPTQWWDLELLGEEIFPCNDLAKECLASTSSCYRGWWSRLEGPLFYTGGSQSPEVIHPLPKAPERGACLHVTGLLVSSREYKLDYKRIPSLGPACLQGGGWGSGVGQGNVGLQLEP